MRTPMELLRPREVRFETGRPVYRASPRPAIVSGLWLFGGALVALALAPQADRPSVSLLALSCAFVGFASSWRILPRAVQGLDPSNWWLHPGHSELLLRMRPHGAGSEHPGKRSVLRLAYDEIAGIRAVRRHQRAFLDIQLREAARGSLAAELRRAATTTRRKQRAVRLVEDGVLRLAFPGGADERGLADVLGTLRQHVPVACRTVPGHGASGALLRTNGRSAAV